jgi:thiol-disulfide isomerase/thioredoxin
MNREPFHRISFLLCLLAIFSLTFVAVARTVQAKAPDLMPEFTLPSAVDDSVIDSKNHAGQVLLINFWATWCGPCREEIPSLIKLRDEHGKNGFEVIGISMDGGGRGLVSRFSKKFEINYPLAMGTPKVARAFGGIIGIPQSFLVDRQGKIVKSYGGLINHDVLDRDIKALLER